MADRYKLDIVQRDKEIIMFTLVIDAPFGYFVEQCHDPIRPFFKAKIHQIKREDFSKFTVNDVPLIRLVERKLEEISAEALSLSNAA